MPLSMITNDRLQKYLRAAGHNRERAIALYGWNIELSRSFYPLLSAAEVSLRNTISRQVISTYGAQWWEDPTFHLQIRDGGKRIVKAAKGKLKRSGRVTSDRMVAELNFGFWVKMLLPNHQGAIWSDFPAPFPNLPDTVSYDDLYERCEGVLELRNRIFHHEPIFTRDLSRDEAAVLELVTWLCPRKAAWIRPYSTVQVTLRAKP